MTISTTASRISHNGNGATTAFSFPYLFLTNADLVVIKVAADGTETTLVLNTGYTVTGAGDDAGGTVTIIGTAPASGTRIVIYRSMAITQEVDYITGDAFPAETHERALDRLTLIAQQQQDAIDRSAKLPVTSTEDADALIADIIRLADSADNIDTLAGIEADITSVAAVDSDVTTVAGIAANVTTVAGIAANVTSVAGNASNINTVAGNNSNVTTVAGISANVTTVAGISSAVTTVAADGTDIGVVAGISADVQAVADIAADVAAVENIAANVTAVAGNSTNINAVAGNATNINAVAGNSTNINAVNANKTNIDSVAGIAANVTTVAGVAADVTAVAGNATNVSAVAANETNIDTVAGVAANVTTVAGISSAVNTVATNSTAVSTVSTNIASVNSAASNMAAIIAAPTEASNAAASAVSAANSAAAAASSLDSFDDRYLGPKSSDPTLDNDGNALLAGALYYSTSEQAMKVYDGADWILATSAGAASMAVFKFVATASQTTFSGTATVGGTLSYTAANIIVFLNGAALDSTDYTATNGTSVVLGTAAAANDELVVVAFKSFTVADALAKTQNLADLLDVSTARSNLGLGSLAVKSTVETADIVDANVTTAKIADGAVTSAKIADGTIATGDIADSAVTSAKLGSGAARANLGWTTWNITESAGVLYFSVSGVNKAKLDGSGNLTVVGNITAYGTV